MGQNKFTSKKNTYFKSNYIDVLEKITPDIYQYEDSSLSGFELNPISKIVNTHLLAAGNISKVLSISSIPNSQTKNLNSVSGISQYFVKQNSLTKINPYLLETKILLPLGTTLANFDTSSEFGSYLSGTLLPKIIPASETSPGSLEENIQTLSALTENSNASSVHNYLIDALGWFYFLNTSADGGLLFEPSSYVFQSFLDVYTGKTLESLEGINGFTEYIWRNYETCSVFKDLSLIPGDFVSGVEDAVLDSSDGVVATYTSGIQKLESLKTWNEIIYSPSYMDEQDFFVKNAFDDYINTGLLLDDLKSKGPYRKFLNILGYHFADVNDEVLNINTLYDIENAPEEYLKYLAELIGFRLRGNSPYKWRHQLRLAVDLYKKSGTLAGIQQAINALVVNSSFDVTGSVSELYESYIPYLIWYSLATESPLFKDLTTWTSQEALKNLITTYDELSLENNIKIVTDSIILDIYRAFPELFIYKGQEFPVPRFYGLTPNGKKIQVYTILNDPAMKPFYMIPKNSNDYKIQKKKAIAFNELAAFEEATYYGPLGEGVYLAGEITPDDQGLTLLGDIANVKTSGFYLKFEGDIEFLFNYRKYYNYPLPPFEEQKYYKNCVVTPDLIKFLIKRLRCFLVDSDFCDQLETFLFENAIDSEVVLSYFNDFLMFFKKPQTPPNFNSIISKFSNYQKNILDLWNGKSSHLHLAFSSTDFDFGKTTYEGDSKYVLYEAAQIINEFTPAHAINLVEVEASSYDTYTSQDTEFPYLNFDKQETFAGYTSGSVLSNFELSGVNMGSVSPGTNDGRGGLNTFSREDVDDINDSLLSSTTSIITAPRRATRRRNYKYLLPRSGYYDRTGFNSPTSFDPSTLENSHVSSLGELTLGYVASSGKFYPVVDPINPSGVWGICEDLSSNKTFSGVDTSNTFPYRGLRALGSNEKNSDIPSATDRYVDRGELPPIYHTIHTMFEKKAYDAANEHIKAVTEYSNLYSKDSYWKNTIQSFANEAIASGLVLNSFDDYINFSFGRDVHKMYKDYTNYFQKHSLSLNDLEESGGNIISHIFGSGVYNGNFETRGTEYASLISNNLSTGSGISTQNAFSESGNGTFIASDAGDTVVPLLGNFVSGDPYNAEFRNPNIISGVEFCDISGAPSSNQFRIFKLDATASVNGIKNPLIENTVVKCKSLGGLPRLRFDLSSYGERRNFLIKDHKFKLDIKALVGEEDGVKLGGGTLGVWIHTQPVSGLFWQWTPNKKWEYAYESDLSIDFVKDKCLKYKFKNKKPITNFTSDYEYKPGCVDSNQVTTKEINDASLNNILDSYFEHFEIEFDTRNYTINNNFEYTDIIPIKENEYIINDLVHTDDTNYIIEIFFIPNNDPKKYLLLESVGLTDLTQREQASLGFDHGLQTSGIPFRKYVKEDKIYLDKYQIRDILKFYNGLIGQGAGVYQTDLASRDATITSGSLELSGGSRLNYRIHPEWGSYGKYSITNYSSLEFDN